ncbi:MAG: hypothetical protein AAGB02_04710 [Pseudomonadota bacterium]
MTRLLFGLSALSMSAAAQVTPAVPPADEGESQFAALDVDASGGLSLSEVQSAAPDVTANTFLQYDTDLSGELSETEFAAWRDATASEQ